MLPATRTILLALTVAAAGCAADESALSLPDSGDFLGDSGFTTLDAGSQNRPDAGSVPNSSGDASTENGDAAILDLCNPVEQTGCGNPTPRCVLDDPAIQSGAYCAASGENTAVGGACDHQECAAGLVCQKNELVGTCALLCNIAEGTGCESLGTEFECRTRLAGTNWGACSPLPPLCNPFTQAPCEANQACQAYFRRSGTAELRCREAGPAMIGETCGSSADGVTCGRGLVCIRTNDTTTSRCHLFCDIDQDCTTPELCTGVVTEPPFTFCQ